MSRWSGKFDLFDHIAGMGGWFDKDGNEVKFGQENVNVYYSDEWRDFVAFKKATGGVLYQHHLIEKVTPANAQFIKEHCKEFDFRKEVRQLPDRRSKAGFREEKYYIYTYWDKEYTEKEINKHGVYITTEIHFETLLDIIKYYPYIVTMAYRRDNKQVVYISEQSFVDAEYDKQIQWGYIGMKAHYDQVLAQHYFEVCQNYLNYDLENRTCIEPINDIKFVDGTYKVTLNNEIDYNHPVTYVWRDGNVRTHWCEPKIDSEDTVIISKEDHNTFLKEDISKNNLLIRYVKWPEQDFKILR